MSLIRPWHEVSAAAGMGPFVCGSHEFVRRLFVTLRDRRWQEVPPTEWHSGFDATRHQVTITARHTSETVDFSWEGTLSVAEGAREVRFAFEGQALRDMEVCRVGLVLLHPVTSLLGSRVTASSPDHSEQQMIGRDISPQLIVDGVPTGITEPFTELSIEREDFGVLRLALTGDLFEIEDQRNWGDASFKTYCTPLRRGFPFLIQAGTLIAQSVHVHFEPAVVSGRLNGRPFARAEDALKICRYRFPSLGRDYRDLPAPEGATIHEPSWQHGRIEIEDPEEWARLKRVLLMPHGAPVELALLTREDEQPPQVFLAFLGRHRARIARIMLSGARGGLPTAEAIAAWRQEFRKLGLSCVPLWAEIRGHFAELNRRRLALDLNVDGVAFPLSATVHGDDAALIADNVRALEAMAQTARRRLNISRLALNPLALHYPSVPIPRFPLELIAAWFAAMLIQAGRAGIASITVADDVIQGIASVTGSLRFFDRMIDCTGWEIEDPALDVPPHVHALALRKSAEGRPRLLLSNLSGELVALALDAWAAGDVEVEHALTGSIARANALHLEIPPFTAVWVNP